MSRPPLGSTLDVLGLSIPFYSLLMMLAVVLGYFLSCREARRLKLPEDTILNYALLAIPLGILGARIYYVLFQWEVYSSDPLEIFRIWNGGLAIYGAVLGGAAAALLLYRKNTRQLLTLLDVLAPSLVLGQAIGRWGNYANMEAYGRPVESSFFHFFPAAVEIQINGQWVWHLAAFFYESLLCFLIFLFLQKIRLVIKRRGDVLLWYMILYGACRAFTESLRTDSLTFLLFGFTLRVSQLVSAALCLIAAGIFLSRCRSRRPYLAFSLLPLGLLSIIFASGDVQALFASCLCLFACLFLSVKVFARRPLTILLFLPGAVFSAIFLIFSPSPALFSVLLQISSLLLIPAAALKVYFHPQT